MNDIHKGIIIPAPRIGIREKYLLNKLFTQAKTHQNRFLGQKKSARL
jgi:hypothetical protein